MSGDAPAGGGAAARRVASIAWTPATSGELRYYRTSLELDELGDDDDAVVARGVYRPLAEHHRGPWQRRGAMSRVPADATAFGRRDAPFLPGIDTTSADRPTTSSTSAGRSRSGPTCTPPRPAAAASLKNCDRHEHRGNIGAAVPRVQKPPC